MMSRFIKKSGLVGAALCLFLTGCGEELWTMTPEEESLIVAYASSAVAKHNKYMPQGLTNYEEEPEPEEEEPPQETVDVPEEEESLPEGTGGTVDVVPEPGETPSSAGTATLAEASGLAPVVAEYHGYQLTDGYMEGSYFALNPEEGNQFLVLNIGLNNPTQQPVECNNLARGVRCNLLINGEHRVEATSTVLLNDFATYLDTLDPGASQETILIFELPGEVAGNIQSLAMELEADGVVYHVDLQ